jgi:hypothetical protein
MGFIENETAGAINIVSASNTTSIKNSTCQKIATALVATSRRLINCHGKMKAEARPLRERRALRFSAIPSRQSRSWSRPAICSSPCQRSSDGSGPACISRGRSGRRRGTSPQSTPRDSTQCKAIGMATFRRQAACSLRARVALRIVVALTAQIRLLSRDRDGIANSN